MSSIKDKLKIIADNVPKVYESGRKSEYDAFWDAYQQNGSRTAYVYGFAGHGWTADNFKPKHSIIAVGNNNYMFNSNKALMDFAEYLEKNKLTLDLSGTTSFSEGFRYSSFTRLPFLDCSKMGNLYVIFGNCSNLHTIDALKVSASNTFGNTFYNSSALKEIRFEGVIGNSLDLHWSTELSAQSYDSIISCLSTTATGVTLTVPTTAPTVYDAERGEGSWGITLQMWCPSNWTIAYA